MALTETAATLEDLARVDGKAELIAGRIVHFRPTGRRPHRVAFAIARQLDDHTRATGVGEACADNIGFAVRELRSGRQSISPDASYYAGPFPPNPMRFIEGAPALAVEVRSEGDYDRAAEEAIAAKRADYFEAGTQVVWDVDPVAETVSVYRPESPEPVVYVRGQAAEAEPALPGWTLPVDEIFR